MINEKIKQLRIENQISQIELAKKLNISRQALGHYENGDRQINIELIKKICVLFDITADELLEMDDFRKNNK